MNANLAAASARSCNSTWRPSLPRQPSAPASCYRRFARGVTQDRSTRPAAFQL